jgi:hypothetical protein
MICLEASILVFSKYTETAMHNPYLQTINLIVFTLESWNMTGYILLKRFYLKLQYKDPIICTQKRNTCENILVLASIIKYSFIKADEI